MKKVRIRPDALEVHKALIPMATQVSSKARSRFCEGYGPSWITRATGAVVYDEMNVPYLDWVSGLGALTLGHGHGMSGKPMCFPLPSPVEVSLAEQIKSWMPWLDMFRFMKTGSNVTDAAVRLARTYTGRESIATFGNYHGMSDWAIDDSKEGTPTCVRNLTERFQRTLDNVQKIDERFACVILEPMSVAHSSEDNQALCRALRERCTHVGAVLILDEVISGFRAAPDGVAGMFGVYPDLWCAGKALANGWPISVVAGNRDIMECFERTHLSGTHFADPVSMQAAVWTLRKMETGEFWKHQALIGGAMMDGIKTMRELEGNPPWITLNGHPHWFTLSFSDDIKQTLFAKECIKRRVLFSGSHFITLAHKESNVRTTLAIYRNAVRKVKDAIDNNNFQEALEGAQVNRSIFRRNQ